VVEPSQQIRESGARSTPGTGRSGASGNANDAQLADRLDAPEMDIIAFKQGPATAGVLGDSELPMGALDVLAERASGVTTSSPLSLSGSGSLRPGTHPGLADLLRGPSRPKGAYAPSHKRWLETGALSELGAG
jgi:hypothetical protein